MRGSSTGGLALVLLLLVCVAPLPGRAGDDPEDLLPDRYRRWLERDVIWIITPEEREAFLSLRTERERDRFVRDFWTARDPDPMTSENEFVSEHRRRMAYADRYLGTDSPRKGWQTDRGRVYILLGPPNDTQRVVSHNEVYPHEIWTYYNLSSLGLPGALNLIFYRAHGLGEYRLYNPALDRDRLFPPSTQISFDDYYMLREAFGIEFARAVEQVAPGMGSNQSADIVAELQSPREIPRSILGRGRSVRTEVESRWSVEQLDVTLETAFVLNDDGSTAVHLAVMLPPGAVHHVEDADEETASMRLDIFGAIRDERGLEVGRIEQTIQARLGQSELAERRRHAFAFEALRSLIPGSYELELTVQDFVSQAVGRIERKLRVEAAKEGPLSLEGPWLGFRSEPARREQRPFGFYGIKLAPRAGARFGPGETVTLVALLREGRRLRKEPVPLDVELELTRGGEPVLRRELRSEPRGTGVRSVVEAVDTSELAPGTYVVRLGVSHEGQVLASGQASFEVVRATAATGLVLFEEQRDTAQAVEHFNRGLQHLSRVEVEPASRHFRIALTHNARFVRALVYLARTRILQGQLDEAGRLLDRARAIEPTDYDLLLTEGSYQLARGAFDKASAALEQATNVGPRTPEALNALGMARAAGKDSEGALAAFEESLAVDPGQKAIAERASALRDARQR